MSTEAVRRRGRPARDARPVEATREAILAAALDLFSRRGFEGAAMRDIAAQARVEHSALRYHYRDKASLWRAALAGLVARMTAEMAKSWRATRGQPPVDRFRAYMRDYVRYCARHPEHARIMVQEASGDSDRVAWIAEEIVRPQHRAAGPIFQALIDEGRLPAIDLRALIYMVSAAAQAPFTLAGEVRHAYGADMSDPAEVERHADSLLALLLREPPAPHQSSGSPPQ